MVSRALPSLIAALRSPAARRPLALGFAAVATLGYLVLLLSLTDACAGGSDSSGYMNHARHLRAGSLHASPHTLAELDPDLASDYLYMPLGYRPAVDGRQQVPTYPAGLPLLIAAASFLVGWEHAADLVMIASTLAGVLLTFATGRLFGLSRHWSAVAAAIVAGSPVYLHLGIQAMSDVPALVWTTAAVLAAWRSRERTAWALAAGGAFALAVLVRPTNLLALAPIGIALGFSARRWAAFIAGGAPGGVFFLLHTHAAYGKYLTTGYGDSAGLGLDAVIPGLAHYARWLPVLFTPVVLGIFALPWSGVSRRAAAVLAGWLLVIAGFYSAYVFTHETWWYLRFLLPIAPALVVGGLLGFRGLFRHWMTPIRSILLAGMALVLVAAHERHWNRRLGALYAGEAERVYPDITEWMQAHLPADAVIAAMQLTGALRYYTDFTFIRWEQLNPERFGQVVKAVESARRPLYAVLFPFEIDEWKAFERHIPGPWRNIALLHDVSIWEWAPARSGDPSGGPEPIAPIIAPSSNEMASDRDGPVAAVIQRGNGWHDREHDRRHTWYWTPGQAALQFESWPRANFAVDFSFSLRAPQPCTIVVQRDGREIARFSAGPVLSSHRLESLQLLGGRGRLELSTDAPPVPESGDPGARELGFALFDPRLEIRR